MNRLHINEKQGNSWPLIAFLLLCCRFGAKKRGSDFPRKKTSRITRNHETETNDTFEQTSMIAFMNLKKIVIINELYYR